MEPGELTVKDKKDRGIPTRENETPILTVEDLAWIEKNSLGLRHVSSVERAKNEAREGFQGDALAIATARRFLEKPDQIANLTETEKEKWLADFEKNVKIFLKGSVGWDINTIPGVENDTVLDVILALPERTGMLLAEFPNLDMGREPDGETILGKFGKVGRKTVSPEKIKGSFSLEFFDFLDQGNSLLTRRVNEPINKENWELLSNTGSEILWGKFVDLVKNCRAKER